MKIKSLVYRNFIWIGLIFLIMFCILSLGVYKDHRLVSVVDEALIEVIQANVTDTKTDVLSVLTEIGNVRLIIVLTIILSLILFIKRFYIASIWFSGTVFLCAAIFAKVLKRIFDRERPNFLPLIEKTTESFPSGHATATTIFYGLLGLALFLLIKKMWKKVLIGLVTLTLISFILVTRVYLGVHYPTDVIAGFLYGSATVFISMGIYQWARLPLQARLRRLGFTDQGDALKEIS